jgi:hypothetical protein
MILRIFFLLNKYFIPNSCIHFLALFPYKCIQLLGIFE